MQWSLLICSVALSLSACRPSLEKQLVGEWLSGCSIDICTITTLKVDHTFSERFDEKDLADPILSGTWRVEGDQLVLHVTWELEGKKTQSVVGKDLRLTISDFHGDKLSATLAEDKNKTLPWKRLH
jgi:hypothetical protein